MKYNKKDLRGKRFGRLTVLEETNKRQDGGSVVWKCKCDCGKIVEISSKRLMDNRNRSCGCYQKEKQSQSMQKLQSSSLFENTNLQLLKKISANKNSSTKRRGVVWVPSRNKYRAFLTCQKKYHFLGYYSSLEDAIKAREEAEERYFKPILDKYKKND